MDAHAEINHREFGTQHASRQGLERVTPSLDARLHVAFASGEPAYGLNTVIQQSAGVCLPQYHYTESEAVL